MIKFSNYFIISLITIISCSCASYKTTLNSENYKLIEYKSIEEGEKCISISRIYSGVVYTGCVMTGEIRTEHFNESIYMLPLNFVLDTLFLPYSIFSQLKKGDLVLKKSL